MARQEGYVIVSASLPEDGQKMTDAIVRLMHDGWVVVGGVQIIQRDIGGFMAYQTLVKPCALTVSVP